MPIAYYYNGTVLATNGTFDFVSPSILQTKAVSIGAAGTFKDFAAFAAWVSSRVIYAAIIVTILAHEVEVGPTLIEVPNSHLIVFQAATPPTNGVPTNADFTEIGGEITTAAQAKAADIAAQKLNYAASIKITSAAASTFGLAMTHGFHIKNLLVISEGRYTLDAGFRGAHQNSSGAGPTVLLENTCHIGGVWQMIQRGGVHRRRGPCAFAHPNPTDTGGPMDFIGVDFRINNIAHKNYCVTPVPFGGSALSIEGATQALISNVMNIKGGFRHAVFAFRKCYLEMQTAIIDGPGIGLTLMDGSHPRFARNTCSLGDVGDFAAYAADQRGFIHNTGRDAYVFAGAGCTIELGDNIFSGGVTYAFSGPHLLHDRLTCDSAPVGYRAGVSRWRLQWSFSGIMGWRYGPMARSAGLTRSRRGSFQKA